MNRRYRKDNISSKVTILVIILITMFALCAKLSDQGVSLRVIMLVCIIIISSLIYGIYASWYKKMSMMEVRSNLIGYAIYILLIIIVIVALTRIVFRIDLLHYSKEWLLEKN